MSVCAIVVTYNRIKYLERCLQSLLRQTVPVEKIIVIDNCSTDLTVEVLHERWLPRFGCIELLQLPENLGGAGGFYAGMQRGIESGCDYLWLMDDDGYPSDNCLEKLLPYAKKDRVVGPIIATDSQDDLLCIPARIPGTFEVLLTLSEFQQKFSEIAEDLLFPFNGTLLPKEIPLKIGLPRKEYFIWGDEIEYNLRIQREQYQVATVAQAVFHHPRANDAGTPMFFGKLRFNNPAQDLKLYCLVRNASRTYLDYKGSVYALLFVVKVMWFYMFTQPSLRRLKIVISALLDSVRGNFQGHKLYLKK